MSYESKIAAARAVIQNFNPHVKKPIADNLFVTELQQAGFVDDESLINDVTWEILENLGLPIGIAKKIARIFRGKEEIQDQSQKVLTKKTVKLMNVEELLQHYNPRDVIDNPVTNRLSVLSRNLRCIVFNPDKTVNVKLSARILKDIEDGLGDRDIICDPDTDLQLAVFPVGEQTLQIADEDPLFEGEMLFGDGHSRKSNCDWLKVPLDVRQLLRIAIEVDELDPINTGDVQDIYEMAVIDNAFKKLSKRYPHACVEFERRKVTGDLPTLKVPLDDTARKMLRKQNPFSVGENHTY